MPCRATEPLSQLSARDPHRAAQERRPRRAERLAQHLRARSLSWKASVNRIGPLKFSMNMSAIFCCGLSLPGLTSLPYCATRSSRPAGVSGSSSVLLNFSIQRWRSQKRSNVARIHSVSNGRSARAVTPRRRCAPSCSHCSRLGLRSGRVSAQCPRLPSPAGRKGACRRPGAPRASSARPARHSHRTPRRSRTSRSPRACTGGSAPASAGAPARPSGSRGNGRTGRHSSPPRAFPSSAACPSSTRAPRRSRRRARRG